MSKRYFFFFLVLTFLFTGCVNDMIEYFDSESYSVRIMKSSELFDKFGNISVSSYNQVLTIKIKANLPERYFPKDSSGEEMSKTRFYVALFPDINTRYGEKDSFLIIGKKHVFVSSILAMRDNKDFTLKIPLYDFFFVPHGKHKIYFKVLQKRFYQGYYSYYSDHYNEEKDTSLVWAIIETEIDVPEIYKTTLCTDSIILRNDDSFSPAGMDFSFRAGLPDIYWFFSYDAGNDDGFLQTFRSREATYSVEYHYPDTVSFLHYKDLNQLNISVWDRDDFSKDDFIGEWKGSAGELVPDKGKDFQELEFDNIAKFRIKVLNLGVPMN
ncbi:MAG: hypothetical protein J7L46_07400 [Bacteroidales bacterium]|nr:hypothetical protein [Bacteroidales bacterium]